MHHDLIIVLLGGGLLNLPPILRDEDVLAISLVDVVGLVVEVLVHLTKSKVLYLLLLKLGSLFVGLERDSQRLETLSALHYPPILALEHDAALDTR